MAKNNINPLSMAELTIAQEIRSVVEVSGVFDGESVSVFARAEEDFLQKIEHSVEKSIGQTIAVSGVSVDAPVRTGGALMATVHLSVEVCSNGVLSDDRKKSTADLALAIIAALDGTAYEVPFTPMPVLYVGSEIYEDSESYVHQARFDAQIFLNKK